MSDLPNLADGKILKIAGHSGTVHVHCRDWQDHGLVVIFEQVIALEAFSPEHTDLSHLEVVESPELLKLALERSDEQSNGHTCYRFISAWSGLPILTLVATEATVSSA